jgi:hypothetical protein
MKKTLVLLSLLLQSVSVDSQVVFAPLGAQWNYLFYSSNFSTVQDVSREDIRCIRDTVIAGDTCRVLTHRRGSMYFNSTTVGVTAVRQTGDTIWFRNVLTNHKWQVLYNFNTSPTNSWTILYYSGASQGFTCTPVSHTSDTINNIVLRKMRVLVKPSNKPSFLMNVTERFGSELFMFYFHSPQSSDGDFFFTSICYKDNTFGQHQFTEYDCDTRNSIHSPDNEGTGTLYPNPATSKFFIDLPLTSEKFKLVIINTNGREIVQQEYYSGNSFSCESLAPGFYHVLLTNGNSTRRFKLVLLKNNK